MLGKSARRRKNILAVLNERRHDTIDNLALEFDVSRRTIRYDVEALSYDYPVYTVQGNGGGVHIVEGCHAAKKKLSTEQAALLDKLLPGLSGDDARIMQEIIRKFGGKDNVTVKRD